MDIVVYFLLLIMFELIIFFIYENVCICNVLKNVLWSIECLKGMKWILILNYKGVN